MISLWLTWPVNIFEFPCSSGIFISEPSQSDATLKRRRCNKAETFLGWCSIPNEVGGNPCRVLEQDINPCATLRATFSLSFFSQQYSQLMEVFPWAAIFLRIIKITKLKSIQLFRGRNLKTCTGNKWPYFIIKYSKRSCFGDVN